MSCRRTGHECCVVDESGLKFNSIQFDSIAGGALCAGDVILAVQVHDDVQRGAVLLGADAVPHHQHAGRHGADVRGHGPHHHPRPPHGPHRTPHQTR